jgi:thioredoxin 1
MPLPPENQRETSTEPFETVLPHVDYGGLTDLVDNNETVILLAYAPWCNVCRDFKQTAEKMAADYGQAKFAWIDIDQETVIRDELYVQAIPSIYVFRDQILIFAQPGALPPVTFDDLMRQVYAIDMNLVRQFIAERDAENGYQE